MSKRPPFQSTSSTDVNWKRWAANWCKNSIADPLKVRFRTYMVDPQNLCRSYVALKFLRKCDVMERRQIRAFKSPLILPNAKYFAVRKVDRFPRSFWSWIIDWSEIKGNTVCWNKTPSTVVSSCLGQWLIARSYSWTTTTPRIAISFILESWLCPHWWRGNDLGA